MPSIDPSKGTGPIDEKKGVPTENPSKLDQKTQQAAQPYFQEVKDSLDRYSKKLKDAEYHLELLEMQWGDELKSKDPQHRTLEKIQRNDRVIDILTYKKIIAMLEKAPRPTPGDEEYDFAFDLDEGSVHSEVMRKDSQQIQEYRHKHHVVAETVGGKISELQKKIDDIDKRLKLARGKDVEVLRADKDRHKELLTKYQDDWKLLQGYQEKRARLLAEEQMQQREKLKELGVKFKEDK